MRGAMYLFPLYANAEEGETGDGREQVHPLPVPPWAEEDVATSELFDVTQLAAMLANVQSDLVYVELCICSARGSMAWAANNDMYCICGIAVI